MAEHQRQRDLRNCTVDNVQVRMANAGSQYTQDDSARLGPGHRPLFQPERLTKFIEHGGFHHPNIY
jgi:hypothetical protein